MQLYASWGTRVGAYLIDGLIVAPFSVLAVVLDGPEVDPATGVSTGGGALYLVLNLVALLIFGYNRWYLTGRTGKSWGKRVLGITLVKDGTEQSIGIGLAFLRDLAHIVDGVICYIGYLFPLWDSKRQTLADKIVRTVVIAG